MEMALGLSMKSLVQFWTAVETSIGAVSRIKSFSEDTPSEHTLKASKTADDWLHSGKIDIQNLSASHGPGLPDVLRDINISIKPGEHVGICGRSGR